MRRTIPIPKEPAKDRCPRGHAIVRACQIRLGDLQVKNGLAFGVVLGRDNLPGLVLIGRAETGALAGAGVHAIKLIAPDTTTN